MIKKIIEPASAFALVVALYLAFSGVGLLPKIQTSFVQTKRSREENIQKEVKELPDVSTSDWDLVLVNETHKVKDLHPPLEKLANGFEMDKRIIPYWEKLLQAARADKIELQIVSAYRSVSYQEKIIQENIQLNQANGLSKEEATEETMKVMTKPGYSEHNSGLALDVVGSDYYNKHTDNLLVEEFASDESAKWLAENCAKYGFILRYIKGATSITGIDFEPWHFRFVGVENAKYMTEHHLTLEEYIQLLERAKK